MSIVKEEQKHKLLELAAELQDKNLNRDAKVKQVLSLIDTTSRTEKGIGFLYEQIEELDSAGIFEDTPWQNPAGLAPRLVRGTLCGAPPNNLLEVLSELRMLKVANGEYAHKEVTQQEARAFIEQMLVFSLDLAFGDLTETARINLSKGEMKRIRNLFDFILSRFSTENLKYKLAEEVATVAEQRPIITYRLESMLHLVKQRFTLDTDNEQERQLQYYVNALFHPTELCRKHQDPDEYYRVIEAADSEILKQERKAMAAMLEETGLVSDHMVKLLEYHTQHKPDRINRLLNLNEHGSAEFSKYQEVIVKLIHDFILKTNNQAVFGLKNLLERNLISRESVWNALSKLMKAELHPQVAANLKKSTHQHGDTAPLLLLVGGAMSVLGQPLGIGQGNNPTCQSARGISMWSQHAPAKLLNMIIDAATGNQLDFRFEGELIVSTGVTADDPKFDFNLDPVSVVLVPHLDSIYGQMMQKAMIKHPADDPHVWVNPAFYGHWIQTGFAACFNNIAQAITNYPLFVKQFYASFHPEYNGGHNLVYPVPIGIFITSANGVMLGFHAISLLRVNKDQTGTWRAYFFNPNNEGRQNWGQGITPTVNGNGEVHGESSLPFYQFVARVYAFHYNSIGIDERVDTIPEKPVKEVQQLAKESWGKKYIWL